MKANANLLLIETIRIQNGRVRNIDYHNLRCNRSRKALFNSKNPLNLRSFIDTAHLNEAEVKCRITYDHEVRKVEYEAYHLRPIHTLKLVEVHGLDYRHKFADRQELKKYFERKGRQDDILMTRKGFLTDTYYANIALLKDKKWYTPEHPLLLGTTRQRLIAQGKIQTAHIHKDEVRNYESIALFNSMIPLGKILVRPENIT